VCVRACVCVCLYIIFLFFFNFRCTTDVLLVGDVIVALHVAMLVSVVFATLA